MMLAPSASIRRQPLETSDRVEEENEMPRDRTPALRILRVIFCGFAPLREIDLENVQKSDETRSCVPEFYAKFGLAERHPHDAIMRLNPPVFSIPDMTPFSCEPGSTRRAGKDGTRRQ